MRTAKINDATVNRCKNEAALPVKIFFQAYQTFSQGILTTLDEHFTIQTQSYHSSLISL